MNKVKKLGLFGAIGGIISSLMGFLGATCVVCAPACGTVCVGGILAVITGTGIAVFLFKYKFVFIAAGILLFVTGMVFIFKSRKKCECANGGGECL